MIAIEVKASDAVGPADTRGLAAFALTHREHFSGGYVVYEGSRIVDLSPRELPSGSIVGVPSSVILGPRSHENR